ncbi:hypothetical protein Sjap_008356 [Stephania japonica]|uniref:Uncharacterized protein n=1 Tax=Stephania japonica TaxID=461633 RepID=A0AAP0JRR1_9MAGN
MRDATFSQASENAKSKKNTVVEVKEVESKELISHARCYIQPSSKKLKGEAAKKELYSLEFCFVEAMQQNAFILH